ncbi:MAG: YbfB/YjiJ family MFS transporter [Pseudomonadota bacterium]
MSWIVVLGLALGVTVSNAFARFAYGIILPEMQADLIWSFTEAGWLNTANSIGYIVGALGTFAVGHRVDSGKVFAIGLLITSISILASGLGTSLTYLTVCRVVAGMAGAPVFISGGALAAKLFQDSPKDNALAIAAYYGGAGLGMLLSGSTLPVLFDIYGPSFWSQSWIWLGTASLIVSPISIWAALKVKDECAVKSSSLGLPFIALLPALTAYTLFAACYIVFLTFSVAWASQSDLTVLSISAAWCAIGIGIIVSPFVWRHVLFRFNSGVPLALACLLTGCSMISSVFFQSTLWFICSSFIFGLAVFAGPGAVTNYVRKNFDQVQWHQAISLFTLFFAIGQSIGPVTAGFVSDTTGELETALVAAGAVLIVATLISLRQSPIQSTQ